VCRRRFIAVLSSFPTSWGSDSHNWWISSRGPGQYAEARLTRALVRGERIPSYQDLRVGMAAWLNGLAEGASELRRHMLDLLRAGESGHAEELLAAMEDAYDLLVTIEYPDAITGGLRRSTDALRAVLERSRSDVTATVVQTALKETIERSLKTP
jgi:translin